MAFSIRDKSLCSCDIFDLKFFILRVAQNIILYKSENVIANNPNHNVLRTTFFAKVARSTLKVA